MWSFRKVSSTLFLTAVMFFIKVTPGGFKSGKFYCTSPCGSVLQSSIVAPVYRAVRSRLECAVTCSKNTWCLRYSFAQNTTTGRYACLLFVYDTDTCPSEITPYGSVSSTCSKVQPAAVAGSDTCKMTRQVISNQGSTTLDYSTVMQMCAYGNDLKMRFTTANSTFIARSYSYTFTTSILPVWLYVPQYLLGVNSGLVTSILRTFSLTSPTGMIFMYCTQSMIGIPDATSVQSVLETRSSLPLGDREIIYQNGGNLTALGAALGSGASITLLMLGPTKRVLTARVVIKDGTLIKAQGDYYESQKYKGLTVESSGSAYLVTWDYINKVKNEAELVSTDYIWYSDFCWSYVLTTQYNVAPSATLFSSLKTNLASGRRLRVGFTAGTAVLYAEPDYINVDNIANDVTLHVVNVLKRESLYNLGLLVFSTSKRHYSIKASGYLEEFSVSFGSDAYTKLDDYTTITWFLDPQNFTSTHLTTINVTPDPTTLAVLVSKVNTGADVRVKVYVNSSDLHIFKCNEVQVTDNGSRVRCLANNLLASDFLGDKVITTTTSGTSGGLLGGGGLLGTGLLSGGSTTTTTYAPTITSGCQQFLTISTSATMTSAISCLEVDSLVRNFSTLSVNVEWFVAV